MYTNPVARLRRTPSTTARRAAASPCSNRRRSTSRISAMGRTYPRGRPGWSPCSAAPAGKEGRVTVIGFHASHEQVHPTELLDAVQRAEEAGFTAAMCSDHFSPWSRRQGHSGFAWSWLGAALATTDAALRRRQRARPALPPGDRRPGLRHPRQPCSPGGCGSRSAPARRRTSTSPATGGRRRRSGAQRLRECVDVIRALHAGEEVSHAGLVRGRPGPPLDASRTNRRR